MHIHTIWAGNATPDWLPEGLRTIRNATGFLNPTEYYFWHIRTAGPAPSIGAWTLKGWSDIEEALGAGAWLSPYNARTVHSIISFELKNRGFSAAKDLLAFIILRLFGGLYLDVSMLPMTASYYWTVGRAGGNPFSGWNPSGDTLRMPIIGAREMRRAVGLSARASRSTLWMAANQQYVDIPRGYPVFHAKDLDVWALFAARGSNVMSNAAVFMISRYMELFNDDLNTNTLGAVEPVAHNDLPQSAIILGEGNYFYKSLPADARAGQKATRNSIIGEAVMTALLDALASEYGATDAQGRVTLTEAQWQQITWQGYPTTENGATKVVLPALGLIKEYRNSWRGA